LSIGPGRIRTGDPLLALAFAQFAWAEKP